MSPLALTRDGAREAAASELSRHEYADARPPLVLRAIGRALRLLGDLLDRATGGIGDGVLARVLFLVVLAGLAAAVLVRLGPVQRSSPRPVLGPGRPLDAAAHRLAAARLAEQQQWAAAVRERLRAVVRELEAGGLEPRPGRTAREAARDGGAAAPSLSGPLDRAATVFDEVVYGGRGAGPKAYDVIVAADDAVCARART